MKENCKKLCLTFILVALCSVFVVCCSCTQSNAYADSGNSGSVIDEIDSYLTDAVSKAHFPALSVTIVDKNDVLLSKCYGSCESVDTPFWLGSVSKSFTALCIMQLVEQGKVDLDTNIVEYLPNATDGNKITVRQLLNHTSGLGEHQNLDNYRIVGKQGVHAYANVNYSLLGAIIEAASNTSYESYVTDNVFRPLHMSRSAATLDESVANGLRTVPASFTKHS